MDCRLCRNPALHVHVSENVTAVVNIPRRPLKVFLRGITNVDWATPAVRYKGRWVKVPIDFLEKVWPVVRDQVRRSAPRPVIEDDQNDQQQDDSRPGMASGDVHD